MTKKHFMNKETIYDIAGVGIGPFNLGLAALAQSIQGITSIFFDSAENFSWHPGLMLESAKLQVPFYADLVTGADPASRLSYFAYLRSRGRLYRFGILEDNYLRRSEYNNYCRWVAGQLENLQFRHKVSNVFYVPVMEAYGLEVTGPFGKQIVYARHIVLGTGSVPSWPDFVRERNTPGITHSSQYLHNRDTILAGGRIAVIGSGQSAAEVFYDLLLRGKNHTQHLAWFTRAPRLYPMDTSKFSLEMASPDYIDYFHSLEPAQQGETLRQQDMLYKGINHELLSEIYAELFHRQEECPKVLIQPNACLTALSSGESGFSLSLLHMEQKISFMHEADHLILATGYSRPIPPCIKKLRGRLRWRRDGQLEVARNYSVDISGREVFVQNAEIHTHGFNAPDLGLGPYRNSVILNTILGYEHFKVERGVPFQSFGIPGNQSV
jgi:lysine N6-hydroxylase